MSNAITRLDQIQRLRLWRLGLALGVGSSPALLGRRWIERVAGLHELSSGPYAYLQADAWPLLYLGAPFIAVSGFLFYLTPGLLLVLALGGARCVAEWAILGFGATLIWNVVAGTAAKLLLGPPLTLAIQLGLWLGATALAASLLILRLQRGALLQWPMAAAADRRRMVAMAVAAWIAVVALLPKIFWENFNLDGVEAFEFGRSLVGHVLPRWELRAGVFGFYPNFVLFAYPNQWFITLFGPFEASVRLPFVLYAVGLFAGLVLLIERGSERTLSALDEGLLWLGLAIYAVVQAYDTGYEPFFADLAETAATDSLWVLCFLAACAALFGGRRAWFFAFAVATYAASPGGLLLLAALAVALFLAGREERLVAAAAFGACLAGGLLHDLAHHAIPAGPVADQFAAQNLLRRLFPPTLVEWSRWNALVFPSGILPALSLFAVRRRDPIAWTLAVVTGLCFGVLYVQAWTALHQFAPVMVLPLVVFWRTQLRLPQPARRALAAALCATTLASLGLSLPRHFRINQNIRHFGLATHYRVGDYERGYEEALRGGWTLSVLLPEDYRLLYPEQPWGADAPSWIYYATREKPAGTRIHYAVQPSSDAPPPDATRLAERDGLSVYVLDLDAWRRDREREFPRVVQSPLYEPIHRATYRFFRAFAE